MAVRWLVDGMNVIGSRPDGWWRDREGAMERLARRLAAFRRAQGEEVAVVFDGRRSGRVIGAGGLVEVGFASGGRNAADRAIAELVEADPDPGKLHVVTSDRELAERVRSAGAEVVGAGDFLGRLEATA
jgi:predicted RNA-binding protein with PIN domain